jgi:hypothetical protein
VTDQQDIFCNQDRGDFAWAACGKLLVPKQSPQDHKVSRRNLLPEISKTQFPTGCAGLWKTLVSVRRLPDHKGLVQTNAQQIGAGFPTTLVPQRKHTTTTTATFPLRLTKTTAAGWVLFRSTNGYFFDCQGSDEIAKVGTFSINKWVLFRLTKTWYGKILSGLLL